MRAIILMRNKEAIAKNINPKRRFFKFQKGIYVIAHEMTANILKDGKIKGAEIIYFEGNPVPLAYEKVKDKREEGDESSAYLDELIINSVLEQTSEGPKIDITSIKEILAPLTNPTNIIMLLFLLVIIYGIIVGGIVK